ncbi:MAG TPA: TetR/AcrR family transcriptional regulator [Gemmatimonadaceae bacterium]|nr:TetR/AcrR family transcriptional regulator [Gemmatimonadaceae bacterium]
MADQTRQYRMKRRAETEQRTRLRITESAVALHGTLGPARTSISAVAQRAGVRRSTVYRHFPDEASLFSACTSYWTAANPVPDVDRWVAIGDPAVRLTAALRELYAHYRRTDRMMNNILRDEATMPIVKRMLGGYRDYVTAARDTLMSGRGVRRTARQRVLAAVGHALTFGTWRSLTREQALTDSQAADLMCRLVAAAAGR